MQPIHIAAVNGKIDVVHHLITKYKIDPRSIDQVIYYPCTVCRRLSV